MNKSTSPLTGSPEKSPIIYTAAVLIILIITSLLLALVMGLMYGKFTANLFRIAFINALSLAVGVLANLFLIRNLVMRLKKGLLMLLAFVMILGVNITGFLYILFSQPLFFLYGAAIIYTYFLVNLIFALTLSLLTTGFLLYEQNIRAREQIIMEEQLLRREMEQKLYSSKLNPHFLFNSLNMILTLLKEPLQAEEAIINLSELLRYYVEAAEKERIPLKEELKYVEKYLSLQKLRFKGRLDYTIGETPDAFIPPLIIQPLVENSVKHNINETKKLSIRIEVSQGREEITISISDSCQKVSLDMVGKGTGLTTTGKRVELAGGTFAIKDGGVEIRFKNDQSITGR